jgi:signal transduction histidine kinase
MGEYEKNLEQLREERRRSARELHQTLVQSRRLLDESRALLTRARTAPPRSRVGEEEK